MIDKVAGVILKDKKLLLVRRPSSEIKEIAWIEKCDDAPVSEFFKKLIYPELVERRIL